jgi:hypothetical protein
MPFEPEAQQTFGSYAMTVKTTNCLVSPSDSNTKNYLLRPQTEKEFLHNNHNIVSKRKPS